MIIHLLIALFFPLTYAYSAGYMSCTNTPNRDTMGTNSPFAIAITDTNGQTVTSYTAGESYNIQLYGTGSTKFRGYIMAGFTTSGTPNYASTNRTGTMTPVSAIMVVQSSCSGGVTQTNGSVDKSSVSSSWSAPIATGTGNSRNIFCHRSYEKWEKLSYCLITS